MSIAFVLFIGLLCYFKGLRWFCALALLAVFFWVVFGDLILGSV